MKFTPKKRINNNAVVGVERSLINKNYNHIECRIQNSILYCYGTFQPTVDSPVYEYRLKYNPPKRPVVNIISPKIDYNDEIHMYPADNSLCLYHKSDLVWDTTCHLFDTIIPWTHEWFVFYELYLLYGEWMHPFVSHKKGNKQ